MAKDKQPLLTPTIKITLIVAAVLFTCFATCLTPVLIKDESSERSWPSSQSTTDPVPLKAESETRFGLSLQERKEFYRKWVQVEDATFDYKTGKIDEVKQEKLHSDLLSEYDLTRQQSLDIGVEALEKNWPLPAIR